MHHTRLAAWLSDQIGSGRRFRSGRELSLAAGLNQNTVNGIIATGSGDPETLVALGRTLDVPPGQMLALGGFLPEDPGPEVGPDLKEIIEVYLDPRLDEEGRTGLLGVARALRRSIERQGGSGPGDGPGDGPVAAPGQM